MKDRFYHLTPSEISTLLPLPQLIVENVAYQFGPLSNGLTFADATGKWHVLVSAKLKRSEYGQLTSCRRPPPSKLTLFLAFEYGIIVDSEEQNQQVEEIVRAIRDTTRSTSLAGIRIDLPYLARYAVL